MDNSHPSGAHSLDEILSQPQCWSAILEDLQQDKKLHSVAKRFSRATEWLFIGCGSGYYVALSAAAAMERLTGLRSRALPASEILLYPDVFSAGAGNCVPVLISRSGHTLEFRHGPKAIVGPTSRSLSALLHKLTHKTVPDLVFLLSERGYPAECEALREMKSLDAMTMVVTNRADDAVRAASDLVVDLQLDVPNTLASLPTFLSASFWDFIPD